MYSKAAVIITAAAGLLLCAVSLGLVIPAHASGPAQFLVTLYGAPDNSPPGDDIAYPVIHKSAGGTGTYSDPITAASDKGELPVGTKIYVPFLHRYFIMEDDCTECDEDWTGHGPDGGPGLHHVDLWVGGQGAHSSKAVISCEDNLTKNSASVIVDPPSSEPVDMTPLFNSSQDACYDPGSFKPGSGSAPPGGTRDFASAATPPASPAPPAPPAPPASPSASSGSSSGSTGPITGMDGLCVDVQGASTADFTPVQTFACNETSAQQWTAGSDGTLQALGKCLGVHHGGTANGTTVDLYHCNNTGGQVWQRLNDGSLFNPQAGKCLDDTNWSATPGTQLQVWSCTDAANQHWHRPGG
jgi:hypothetical protein